MCRRGAVHQSRCCKHIILRIADDELQKKDLVQESVWLSSCNLGSARFSVNADWSKCTQASVPSGTLCIATEHTAYHTIYTKSSRNVRRFGGSDNSSLEQSSAHAALYAKNGTSRFCSTCPSMVMIRRVCLPGGKHMARQT